MNSRKSLKKLQDHLGRASILGIPFYTLGGDRTQIKDELFRVNAGSL